MRTFVALNPFAAALILGIWVLVLFALIAVAFYILLVVWGFAMALYLFWVAWKQPGRARETV